jgi:hypothetical protein
VSSVSSIQLEQAHTFSTPVHSRSRIQHTHNVAYQGFNTHTRSRAQHLCVRIRGLNTRAFTFKGLMHARLRCSTPAHSRCSTPTHSHCSTPVHLRSRAQHPRIRVAQHLCVHVRGFNTRAFAFEGSTPVRSRSRVQHPRIHIRGLNTHAFAFKGLTHARSHCSTPAHSHCSTPARSRSRVQHPRVRVAQHLCIRVAQHPRVRVQGFNTRAFAFEGSTPTRSRSRV